MSKYLERIFSVKNGQGCKVVTVAGIQKKFPWKPESYPMRLGRWYEGCMGEPLNLETPLTFSEKIQWLKLHASTPLKTRLADKYQVRDFVREKIGEQYLVPLPGVYNHFDEIDFEQLPEKFVMKANHGCGYNVIVRDRSTFDRAAAREKFKRWLDTDFAFSAGLELHYHGISPRRIIIEQYLENFSGDLWDFKIWCFGGRAKFIQLHSERARKLKIAFYDTSWRKQDFSCGYPMDEKTVERPENLDEMLRLAERLSEGFCYVRVDFYRLNSGALKFGEMTFTPASGAYRWSDPAINRMMGDWMDLSKEETAEIGRLL